MDKEADKNVADSKRRVDELKDRLDRGDYAVDPAAVAEAILRRSRDHALVRAASRNGFAAFELTEEDWPESAAGPDQNACSYPRRGETASVKVTRGWSVFTTRPIQAIGAAGSTLARRVSIIARAAGAAQMQSS
jgi:hypothetical protein